MKSVNLLVNAYVPENGMELVAAAEWSEEDIERLRSWKKYFDALPKEINPYCVECFNSDVQIMEKSAYADGDLEVMDSDTTYHILSESDEITRAYSDFRPQCVTIHLTDDGVYWTWHEKHTGMEYESHKIMWSEFDELLKEVEE